MWVRVVQRNDETDVNLVVRGVIEEPATLGMIVERPAGRVHDQPFVMPGRINFPGLLEADAIMLRIRVCAKIEAIDKFFAEITADTFSEDRVTRGQFVPGLIGVFFRAIFGDPHIGRGDAGYPSLIIVENLGSGEAWKYVDAEGFGLLPEPLTESPETNDVVSLVMHRPGYEQAGRPEALVRARQKIDVVALDLGLDGRTSFFPVRKQLIQSRGLEDVARQYVGTDFGSFLYDDDRQACIALHQATRRREARRPTADNNNVEFHHFACSRFCHIARSRV